MTIDDGEFKGRLFRFSSAPISQCPQEGVKNLVQRRPDVLGQEPQHHVTVLLQQEVLPPVAAMSPHRTISVKEKKLGGVERFCRVAAVSQGTRFAILPASACS